MAVEPVAQEDCLKQLSVPTLQESDRGRVVRTLEKMLRVSKREARRRGSPSSLRLKWVNTICYIAQTYNSLLRDVEYDQVRQEVLQLQEKVRRLSEKRTEPAAESNTGNQHEPRQSGGAVGSTGPG